MSYKLCSMEFVINVESVSSCFISILWTSCMFYSKVVLMVLSVFSKVSLIKLSNVSVQWLAGLICSQCSQVVFILPSCFFQAPKILATQIN